MARYSIKRRNRKIAPFGSQEAATLAAAAINVAGTIAGATMQANAAKDAAKKQADAMNKSAKEEANALSRQNENANNLQEKSIEFQREQNQESRDVQKEIQMNLQMLAGQQNHNDRLEANKIQVRNGGRTRRRCLSGGMQIPLRASSNLPFVVTDGGGVLPLGSTPEGFNLYEIRGDNHEQYHKARNGYKSGVGFKFADGNVIEGEGGKKGNDGELLLTTPNDAFFISKHSIKGFDPADAVKSGMHPLQAFNIQENIKNMYGISDSGRAKFGKRKCRTLGGLQDFEVNTLGSITPSNDVNLGGGASGGAAYLVNNESNYGRQTLKCGGRKKAALGVGGANWLGAGISSTGDFIGAGLFNWGNNRASKYIKDAYRQSGDIIARAYGDLRGIDEADLFSRDDFQAAHMLPALRTARYNIEPQLTEVERSAQRRMNLARRGNLSSAAMQERVGNIETDAYDQRSKLYGVQSNAVNDIHNRNVESINQAAQFNAQADNAANERYTNARISLAQYNNNIANQRILGIAKAKSDALTGIAQTDANRIQANANAWGSAITSGAGYAADTLTTNAKMQYDADQAAAKHQADVETALLGSDSYSQFKYAMQNKNYGDAVDQAIITNNIDIARKLLNIGTELTEEQRKALYNKFGNKLFDNIAKYGTSVRNHRSLKR